MKTYQLLPLLFTGLICASQTENLYGQDQPNSSNSFQADLTFLKQHTPIILLQSGQAAVALAPNYQGRVMTSTFDLATGPSFGWINRRVIAAGLLSEAERKGKLEEHIYVFGGEERFWLGPEGGQYALFFKPNAEFEFANWVTPSVIDTDPFQIVHSSATSAKFKRDCDLVNYHGTKFLMGIERTIKLLDQADLTGSMGINSMPLEIKYVAYESDNRLTNRGQNAWKPETGLPSIWLLGMYNPSPNTMVVIPFNPGDEKSLGPKVNDSYFGKVPPEYLNVQADVLFFRGDGTRRGKIGISPQRSKGIAGSYDADRQLLTLVTYQVQAAPYGYVNSMWEHQVQPYQGDVINSYNDGSPAPGEQPLGPFYELESSSPAAALHPGETMHHRQQTVHLHGPEEQLTIIAEQLLGVSIEQIKRGSK